MKKTLLLYILLSFIVVLSSCSKNEKEEKKEIENIANEFLLDFYYNSFKYAKANTDKKTKSFLDYIEKHDKQEYRSQSFESIDSVSLTSKDSALVYYRYTNSYNKKDQHILPLVKQNGTWLVSIENKNNIDFYRYVFDYSLTEVKRPIYKELKSEELVEVNLFMSTFIKQVNHPKMVAGILGKSSLSYYDIEDLESYNNDYTESNNYNYTWNDLSSLELDVYLEFDYNNVLSDLEYFISNLKSSKVLGVFDRMETILIKEYGEPFNKNIEDSEKWYKSLRWFIKGKNEVVELLNNEDGTISLSVKESEPENVYNY